MHVISFREFIGDGSTGIVGALNTVIIPLIGAFLFAAFVWGVFKYFFLGNKGDEKALAEGRDFIFWGILGMAVFFSIWGVVNMLLSTLGIAP